VQVAAPLPKAYQPAALIRSLDKANHASFAIAADFETVARRMFHKDRQRMQRRIAVMEG
jgi:hypothetical protein